MRALYALSLLLLAGSCGPLPLLPIEEPPGPLVKDVLLIDVGLSADAMDRTADPCQDFHRFACGGWQDAIKIPGDQPRWMRSFSEINKRNEEDLKTILENAAKGAPDPVSKKIGDFYAGCMDEATIESADRKGLDAVWKLLASLAPSPDEQDGEAKKGDTPAAPPAPAIHEILADLHGIGIHAFFSLDASQDRKNATLTIAEIDQAGLGLPDRDYYLEDNERMRKLRAFYVGHLERVHSLLGAGENAKAAAEAVMRVETELAKFSMKRVDRRDPELTYNKIDRKGLRERKKAFDWDGYFAKRGLGGAEHVNVTSLAFVDGFGDLIGKLSRDDVRVYLEWHIVHSLAPSLPSRFVNEDFSLRQKISGQKEQKPRWKRCVAATDHSLGELLAQPYVAKRFTAESKQAVIEMVSHVSRAFRKSLGHNQWMDHVTRDAAVTKLDKMAYLIGYPDKWKKYEFSIDRQSHTANVVKARQFDVARDMAKIGKPIDRSEWFMTPQTVNAYYSSSRNQMVFPAGILQTPFFDGGATMAVNMGGMGMVVGHELTHGFDDKGSKFDGDGNLSGWWGTDVRSRFEGRTKCVDDQYSQYEALPGVKLNGKLTLGENIADAGGVKLAFHAYRAMRESPAEVYVADGFDEDQQFFISMAQVWCFKYRKEYAVLRATTDSHSQPNWRVNGALRNTPEFAEAYQCTKGTPMFPEASCQVW
jgi:putative endopeptidase